MKKSMYLFVFFTLCMFAIIVNGCSGTKKDKDVDLTELVPAAGAVVEFEWIDLTPNFSESPNHSYGFDKDPSANTTPASGSDVYVSVATGENALVNINLSDETYASYALKNTSTGVSQNVSNGEEISLMAGNYALYGVNGTVETILDRNIHVIEYAPKIIAIKYLEFNRDWNPELDDGSYTLSREKEHFDDVYKQAVVKGDFEQKSPSDYGLPSQYEVDMANIDQTLVYNVSLTMKEQTCEYQSHCEEYNNAVDAYNTRVTAYREIYNKGEENWTTEEKKFINSEYPLLLTAKAALDPMKLSCDLSQQCDLKAVLAINQMRFYWPLVRSSANASHVSLINGLYIWDSQSTFWVVSTASECSGVGLTPMQVQLTHCSSSNHDLDCQISDLAGKTVNYDATCDIIYTDDAYPIVPDNLSAAQVTFVTGLLNADNTVSIYGGVIWAARQVGESSHNTLLHEVGHTLGLADVVVPVNTVVNGFATTEANLMSWIVPTGPKLRYRGQQVTCTGGDGTGTGTALPISGLFENQWDCLRGLCEDLSLLRKDYWIEPETSICADGE